MKILYTTNIKSQSLPVFTGKQARVFPLACFISLDVFYPLTAGFLFLRVAIL
jgi:hypothetical protein